VLVPLIYVHLHYIQLTSEGLEPRRQHRDDDFVMMIFIFLLDTLGLPSENEDEGCVYCGVHSGVSGFEIQRESTSFNVFFFNKCADSTSSSTWFVATLNDCDRPLRDSLLPSHTHTHTQDVVWVVGVAELALMLPYFALCVFLFSLSPSPM